MWILDLVTKIGGVISAAGIICGLLITIIKITFKPITKKIDNLTRHTEENYMCTLRLTIMSSEMPIGERIVAGKKYLDNGGNGEVKKFLENEFNITKSVCDAPHYKK